MIVSDLIAQLNKLDPTAEVWLPDCWPFPGEAKLLNTIVREPDGCILFVCTELEDMELYDDTESNDELIYRNPEYDDHDGTEEDVYLDHFAYLEAMRELHEND
jgi:hypothetical protein